MSELAPTEDFGESASAVTRSKTVFSGFEINLKKTFLIHNRNIIADAYVNTLLARGHNVVVIESEADRGAPHIVRAKNDPRVKVVQLVKPGERVASVAKAWIDPNRILDIMFENDITDIVVGYGFLSENPKFAEYCEKLGYKFHGPSAKILKLLGSKYNSKIAGRKAGMEVADFSDLVVVDYLVTPEGATSEWIDGRKTAAWEKLRAGVEQAGGYPVMLKADEGGGGRGQQRCDNEAELRKAFEAVPPQALKFFGSPNIFLEKFVEAAPGARIHHIEVQFARDHAGDTWFSPRECSLQINRQKVFEMTADFRRLLNSKWAQQRLTESQMSARAHQLESRLFEQCERLINDLGYVGIGTAEFLFDTENESFRFMEVNPRIQVEHGVTEEAESANDVRLDLKHIQTSLTEGGLLREFEICHRQIEYRKINGSFPKSERKFVIEARINAVNMATRTAAAGLVEHFNVPPTTGVRADAGIGEKAIITGILDPHIVNVIAYAGTFEVAHRRLLNALSKTVLTGVTSNLDFLCRVLSDYDFINAQYDIGYLDQHQRRFGQAEELDGLANYIAYRTVNPEGKRLEKNVGIKSFPLVKPVFDPEEQSTLIALARNKKRKSLHAVAGHYMEGNQEGDMPFLITETGSRDGQQSEYASRFLASTLLGAIPYYRPLFNADLAKSGAVSLELWGGATFDTLMRFSLMNPYELLRIYASLMPEVPIQALFRGSNVLGYASQPDNMVRETVKLAAKNGLDKVRIFDSLNNPVNAEVCIKESINAGLYVAGAVCYVDQPVEYFVKRALQFKTFGCHQIDIKDMAGVGKPRHVADIIRAIKKATGLLVGYHTHDTSTWAAATIHTAIEAGVDVVDLAVDSMANGSSQPSLNAALRFERESGRVPDLLEITTSQTDDIPLLDTLSEYFNRDLEEYRSRYWDPAGQIKSLVDELGMPGGQITNLIAQAKAAGLTSVNEFKEITAEAKEAGVAGYNDLKTVFARYKEIGKFIGNATYGKPPLVTPSSKGVGDEAITAALFAKKQKRPTLGYAEMLGDMGLNYVPSESFKQLIRGEMGLPPEEHTFPDQVARMVLLRSKKDEDFVAGENKKYIEKCRQKDPARLEGCPTKYDDCGRLTDRPGAFLDDVVIDEKRRELEKYTRRNVTEEEVNAYILFKGVFEDYDKKIAQHGSLPAYLPPPVFFGGLTVGQNVIVDFHRYRLDEANDNASQMILDKKVKGGTIELVSVGNVNHGYRVITMNVKGEPRSYTVADLQWMKDNRPAIPVEKLHYDPNFQNPAISPSEGLLSTVARHGQMVKKGELVAVIDLMKMENRITALRDGYINRLTISNNDKQVVLLAGSAVGDGSVLFLIQDERPPALPAGFDDEQAEADQVVNLEERKTALRAKRGPEIPGSNGARHAPEAPAARLGSGNGR